MKRLAIFVIFAGACGGSGYNTDAASLTGVLPSPMSASGTIFTEPSNTTLGWTIDFFSQGPGTDCMDKDNTIVASIGIFTTQTDNGSHMAPMVNDGDILIVAMSPPTIAGQAAANMGATSISDIVGTVTITDAYKDHINGTVNAGGKDKSGNSVSITGDFKAPLCGPS
jgi:hypothetical protein